MIIGGGFGYSKMQFTAKTTGENINKFINLSPDEYSIRDEEKRIENDPYWGRYNDTDKFEVIKV